MCLTVKPLYAREMYRKSALQGMEEFRLTQVKMGVISIYYYTFSMESLQNPQVSQCHVFYNNCLKIIIGGQFEDSK